MTVEPAYASLTRHATARMQLRGISVDEIDCAIRYGRRFFTRGAIFFVIGRRELGRYQAPSHADRLDGLHVVCSADGRIITVYRNPDFKRKQFSKSRHRCRYQHSF